jgi:hypothetical protein
MFALLLAFRSLAPAGFMPQFDHGRIAIVICPDAEAVSAPMAAHQHHSGDHGIAHHPCPYASMSALGALGPDQIALLQLVFFAVALLLGRTFLLLERQRLRDRPPAIGPPIPA